MKHHLEKSNIFIFVGLAFILFLANEGSSQEVYPSRPVTCIVAFPAGGATDLAFRLLTKEMEKYLGQPIVILNKPGAGGRLAFQPLLQLNRTDTPLERALPVVSWPSCLTLKKSLIIH